MLETRMQCARMKSAMELGSGVGEVVPSRLAAVAGRDKVPGPVYAKNASPALAERMPESLADPSVGMPLKKRRCNWPSPA